MNQLPRILLHMHLMDTDFLFSCRRLDLHISVSCNRQIQLGNLIILWVVGIKIVLAVKLAHLRDLTVCSKPQSHRILYHLFIQYREGARHTRTHRAGMRIWRAAEFCTAAAENLGLCGKLNVDFQSDHGFILS